MAESQGGTVLTTDLIVSDPTTRYFLIKSFSNDNIGRSLQYGVWATSGRNEKVFTNAYRTSAYVVLIFSVNYSSRFSGFGVITSEPGQTKYTTKSIFCGADGAPFPGQMFSVHWIANCEVFFRDCESILNAFNDNKSVKVGRDGQEIDPVSGRLLCLLIDSKQPSHNRPAPLILDTPLRSSSSNQVVSKAYPKAVEPQLSDKSKEKDKPTWNLDWVHNSILKNPIYSVFPMDLTQIPNYQAYVNAYEESKVHWANLEQKYTKLPSLPPSVQFPQGVPVNAELILQCFSRSVPSSEIHRYLQSHLTQQSAPMIAIQKTTRPVPQTHPQYAYPPSIPVAPTYYRVPYATPTNQLYASAMHMSDPYAVTQPPLYNSQYNPQMVFYSPSAQIAPLSQKRSSIVSNMNSTKF